MIPGRRHRAPPLLRAILMASCLAGRLAGCFAGLSCIAAWAEPSGPAAQDRALQNSSAREAAINPLGSIDPRSLTAFRDRPLFETSRRRFVPPRAVPETAPVARMPAALPPSPAPNLQLLGLIQIDGSDLAILRDLGDRKVHRLRTGDVIQDWTVTIVSHAAIELSRDGDRRELRMFSSRGDQTRPDADASQDDEPSPVKVPELTMEMFKKRNQTLSPSR